MPPSATARLHNKRYVREGNGSGRLFARSSKKVAGASPNAALASAASGPVQACWDRRKTLRFCSVSFDQDRVNDLKVTDGCDDGAI